MTRTATGTSTIATVGTDIIDIDLDIDDGIDIDAIENNNNNSNNNNKNNNNENENDKNENKENEKENENKSAIANGNGNGNMSVVSEDTQYTGINLWEDKRYFCGNNGDNIGYGNNANFWWEFSSKVYTNIGSKKKYNISKIWDNLLSEYKGDCCDCIVNYTKDGKNFTYPIMSNTFANEKTIFNRRWQSNSSSSNACQWQSGGYSFGNTNYSNWGNDNDNDNDNGNGNDENMDDEVDDLFEGELDHDRMEERSNTSDGEVEFRPIGSRYHQPRRRRFRPRTAPNY